MAFDPSKFGATPASGFDPSKFGATPVQTAPPSLQTLLTQRGQDIVSAVQKPSEMVQAGASPLEVGGATAEAGLKTAGNVAGGVLDIINTGLSAIMPNFVKNIMSSDQKGSSPTLERLKTQGATSMQKLVNWAQAHPDAAQNLDSAVDIGSLLLLGETPGLNTPVSKLPGAMVKGAQSIADLVPGGTKATLDAAGKSTWETIKPTLSPSELAEGVKSGKVVTKGMMGTVTQVPTGSDLEMIDAAEPYVASAKNPVEAVANMKQGIADKSIALRAGLKDTGAIYSKSQIVGALGKIEEPTLIASDATLSKAYQLVKDKMISLVGDGGTLDKLLDARSSFDSFIQKQFPNLYSSDTLTPMRSAVRDVRSAVNDVIESRLPDGKLPDGTSFRDSLRQQSLLYDAIDNTAPKVGKIGTTKLTIFTKKHPRVAGAIKTGITVGVGGEIAKKLGLLP